MILIGFAGLGFMSQLRLHKTREGITIEQTSNRAG
jgi:hypothetical protein